MTPDAEDRAGVVVFDDVLREMIEELPQMALEVFLLEKYRAAGHEASPEEVRKLVRHFYSGHAEPFKLSTLPNPDGEIELSLTEGEWQSLSDEVGEKIDREVPRMVEDAVRGGAAAILAKFKKEWRNQSRAIERDAAAFKDRIEMRWGRSLNLLRLQLYLSRGIGEEVWERRRAGSQRWAKYKGEALQRLHSRICQIADETIVLLEHGYADGAMARWRTLHEVTTVMELIGSGDEDLAERYLAHIDVEVMRAFEVYLQTQESLGYRAPSARTEKAVRRRYDAAIKRYGMEFGREYGWASKHLGHRDPKFSRIAEAAGQSRMRSHYKLASYSVHAGVKGITQKLGVLGPQPHILSGASNAGLHEPGQNTLITLTRATWAFFMPQLTLDDIVRVQVVATVRDQGVAQFISTGRKLDRDHRRLEREAILNGGAGGT